MKQILLTTMIAIIIFTQQSTIGQPGSPAMPYVNAVVKNIVFTSATTFEFDVFLSSTGTNPFHYGTAQYAFNFNPAIVQSGATLTMSLVSGSSQIPSAIRPNNFLTYPTTGILYITARIPVVGLLTIAQAPAETKVGRFKVLCSQPFLSENINLTWRHTSVFPETILIYSDDPDVGNTYEITDDHVSYSVLGGGFEPEAPTSNVYGKNILQLSDSSFQFDVKIKKTGAVPFNYVKGQYAFSYNTAIRPGGIGGNWTLTITNSELPVSKQCIITSASTSTNGIFYLTAPPDNLTDYYISDATEVLVARVVATLDVSLVPSTPLNLLWRTAAPEPFTKLYFNASGVATALPAANLTYLMEPSFAVVPHFNKVWQTPYQPMNIYVSTATIDGVDLSAGDEIAVFDGDNCVGLGLLTAPIPTGSYLSIIASTDDPTTTAIDGFIPGHSITYKFWDSSRSTEITRITANYLSGSGIFNSLGTALVELVGRETITQNIGLTTGWNIFSLRVTPNNSNMLQVLNPLITSNLLIKVQDEAGNAVEFLPAPFGWVNNIGNWMETEGYYIKVNAPTILSITDPPVGLPLNIPLKNGWNIISYPVGIEQNALTVLQPLITANQLIKVQDEAGNAVEYLPVIGWINNIGNFKAGEGYYLKASIATNLVLNETLLKPVKRNDTEDISKQLKITTNHFQPIYTSPYLAMNIYVTNADLINGNSLGEGDEIAIFDGDYCVGAKVLSGLINPSQPLAMIASTDDPLTPEIDGFTPSHSITFRFWLSANELEVTSYVANYTVGNGFFVSQGTALVSLTDILPVELTSFSAKANGNKVILIWITATETNNYGFEIEKKILGREAWQRVGFLNGSGNSNSPKSYEFIDKDIAGASKFFYRLKMIDNDGTIQYSGVVEAEVELPKDYAINQNYPNPFNPITKIEYQIPEHNYVTLKICDMLGTEITTLVNEEKPAGRYEVNFDANNLSSGMYLYILQAGEYRAMKKMLLLK